MPTGIFWRLADVADGYWRRHYGQRDRQGRVVTVRVDGMTFTSGRRWRRGVLLRPLREARQHLGDNQYRSVGEKVSSEPIGQRYKATEALFIYVAVDNQENHVLCQRNKKVPGLPGT